MVSSAHVVICAYPCTCSKEPDMGHTWIELQGISEHLGAPKVSSNSLSGSAPGIPLHPECVRVCVVLYLQASKVAGPGGDMVMQPIPNIVVSNEQIESHCSESAWSMQEVTTR